MRKITFLLGAAAGFVLGSKAGSGPYQQLESKVRNVAGRRGVQDAVDRAKGVGKDQISRSRTSCRHRRVQAPATPAPW